jgi:acetyl esterase/lipase
MQALAIPPMLFRLLILALLLSPNPASAELRFEKLGSYTGFADCFFQGRGNLREDTYVWKNVGGFNLRAYVVYPPDYPPSAPLPVIAFFHGGGWSFGNPTYWLAPAHYFASRGIVAVTFQYRLARVHNSSVADAADDARDAVQWLHLNASALGVHPDKIVAAGDSAGGHLALLAALTGDAMAAAAFYPVIVSINGMASDDTPMNVLTPQNADPLTILQGTADTHPATPPAVAKGFCTAAALYRSCRYVEVPGAPHAFLNQDDRYVTGIAELDRWLSQILDRPLSDQAYRNVPKWVANSKWHCRSLDHYPTWSATYGYTTGPMGLW